MYPFLLSLLAGLSTVIGAWIVVKSPKNDKTSLGKSLAISGGIMLTLSFLELLKEGTLALSSQLSGSFLYLMVAFAFFLGMLLSSLLDGLIDEQHLRHKFQQSGQSYKIGLIMVITLMIHNFPEGMITFVSGYQDLSLGIGVTIGIIMHNIPEGIAIASPIYFSTKNPKKAIFYSFISGLAEPLGAFFAMLFLQQFLNPFYLGILFILVAGIMVNVSFQELLKNSIDYIGTFQTFCYFALGVSFMTVVLFLL